MKKTNSNILLTALGLIFSSANVFATECTPAPDCASLGYSKTATDCEGLASIKCPFDTSKMTCFAAEESQVEQNVSVGDILYGDGTVSSEPISGKQAIGVVFDSTNRLAVALINILPNVWLWSAENCDVPNLENCEDRSTVTTTCGTDGRANTNAILATNLGCAGITEAANRAYAYQPDGCSADFCKAGKWFLPSIRELKQIHRFIKVIDDLMPLLGGSFLEKTYYWSSTEHSDYAAWTWGMDSTGVMTFGKNNNYLFVRPVLAF